jgi:hypothetical protein
MNHRATINNIVLPKSTSRGNPGCAVGSQTPTGVHLPNWPLSGFLETHSAIIHRTVRCAPDSVRCAPSQLATLGFSRDVLRYNSPDCTVCTGQCLVSQWSNGHYVQRSSAKVNSVRSELRAASKNAPDISGVPPDYPVQLQDKGLQRSTALNPNGQLTWHALDTEQCPVRCTIDNNG